MEPENVLHHLFHIIDRYHRELTSGSFVAYHEPAELKPLLGLEERSEGDWQQLFYWVETYLAYAVKTANPGYVNRMWAGANLPSIVGEIVTAVTNTSACTFETAPVSTLMEQYMFQEMLDLVGFENGVGQMTTGSSNANMIVMMAARHRACPSSKKKGLYGRPRLCAFVNKDAHYSMDRAAAILGIGTENLMKIATDGHGRMDPAELEARLEQVADQQAVPFFVAATAGTTVRGAYDALEPLLTLRDKYGFWLHVDGAWGGAALMSDRLRARFLPHVEKADSFTLDFHKMLGTSLMCNVLLFNRRPKILREICSAGDESYIFREGAHGEIRDLGSQSLQCGRRVDALKWFLDWKFYGKDGLAKRVEEYLELCTYAELCINRSEHLEMVVPRESFNVCFRYTVPAGVVSEDFTIRLRNRMQEKERALIGTGYVDGELAFRLLITNVSVGRQEVEHLLETVAATGRELEKEDMQVGD